MALLQPLLSSLHPPPPALSLSVKRGVLIHQVHISISQTWGTTSFCPLTGISEQGTRTWQSNHAPLPIRAVAGWALQKQALRQGFGYRLITRDHHQRKEWGTKIGPRKRENRDAGRILGRVPSNRMFHFGPPSSGLTHAPTWSPNVGCPRMMSEATLCS